MPFLNDDKFYNFIFYALRIQIQNRIFISISDILKVFFINSDLWNIPMRI